MVLFKSAFTFIYVVAAKSLTLVINVLTVHIVVHA